MGPVSLTCFHLQNFSKVFAIPETLFEQTWISLPQGYSMPNINAFWPVVHEKKIFEDLSKFSLFSLLIKRLNKETLDKSSKSSCLGDGNSYLFKYEQIWIPIPQACFLTSLVEIGLAVLEKKIFKHSLYITM